jgi:hypothetical protein
VNGWRFGADTAIINYTWRTSDDAPANRFTKIPDAARILGAMAIGAPKDACGQVALVGCVHGGFCGARLCRELY